MATKFRFSAAFLYIGYCSSFDYDTDARHSVVPEMMHTKRPNSCPIQSPECHYIDSFVQDVAKYNYPVVSWIAVSQLLL
jgi:hypothetical protein